LEEDELIKKYKIAKNQESRGKRGLKFNEIIRPDHFFLPVRFIIGTGRSAFELEIA
jgi:hypothetical protein